MPPDFRLWQVRAGIYEALETPEVKERIDILMKKKGTTAYRNYTRARDILDQSVDGEDHFWRRLDFTIRLWALHARVANELDCGYATGSVALFLCSKVLFTLEQYCKEYQPRKQLMSVGCTGVIDSMRCNRLTCWPLGICWNRC